MAKYLNKHVTNSCVIFAVDLMAASQGANFIYKPNSVVEFDNELYLIKRVRVSAWDPRKLELITERIYINGN